MHPWVRGELALGLLASCLARPCLLWTRDSRLAAIAAGLGVAFE